MRKWEGRENPGDENAFNALGRFRWYKNLRSLMTVLVILISLKKKNDGKNNVVLYNPENQINHKSYRVLSLSSFVALTFFK